MLQRLGYVGRIGKAGGREGRKNFVTNASLAGAVVSGALPTGWSILNANGLTTTVIAVGTVNGLRFIDLRFSGTTSGTFYVLAFGTAISSAPGFKWVESFYSQLIAGSLVNITNTNVDLRMNVGTADVVYVAGGSLTQVQSPLTTPAGNTNVTPAFLMAFGNGVAIDVTLRLAGVQLEHGLTPTGWIPT